MSLRKVRRRARRSLENALVYISNHVINQIIFSRVRLFWYRRVMRFQLGRQTSVLTDFKVARRSNIIIGNNSVINNSCRFDNRFPIIIGSNVSITYGTMILTKGHDIDDPDFKTKGASVIIEDYVWICAAVIIQPGVKIMKGAVVLPGSVVTRDVQPYRVVGGNPAKFIRLRSQDLHYKLHFDPWVPFFG